MFAEIPIPPLHSVRGWKSVPIEECGEGMVSLEESERVRIYPVYHNKGYKSAGEVIVVRRGVAERLNSAAHKLPKGYSIVILDGWRPLALQKELFEEQLAKLKAKDVPPGRLVEEAQKYVSIPSENPACPPPHSTGGAVDLTITTREDWLDAGCDFDTWTEFAGVRFYERLLEERHLSSSEIRALHTRRRIYHLLTSVGFASYDEEWWHFDFGNQFWAKATNRSTAIYGKVGEYRGI